MGKAQILRHIADNIEKGLDYCDGLFFLGGKITHTSIDWNNLLKHSSYVSLAPKTHIVNGFEVPAPMSEKPDTGRIYYVPMPCDDDWVEGYTWYEDSCDNKQFVRGLCYTTKEAAAVNAKAMVGIDPYKIVKDED